MTFLALISQNESEVKLSDKISVLLVMGDKMLPTCTGRRKGTRSDKYKGA